MDPHSHGKPWRRRKRKSGAPSASDTTIQSLSDDVLADILVRLPSPASLGRAALACARWRRLARSGDFLRRYRALHPSAPLLGCFISFSGSRLSVFHRVPDYYDRDLAAAARGGDFLLTSFTRGDRWTLEDCFDGLLLLSERLYEEELALFDPVSRRRVRIPFPPHVDLRVNPVVCLLPSPSCGGGDVDASFRVGCLEYRWQILVTNGRVVESVRAHVYSSSTGEWRSASDDEWSPPLGDYDYSDFFSSWPMHAAGRIYWKYLDDDDFDCNVLLSLNSETMEFSYVALPPVPDGLFSGSSSYAVGDLEDGTCCLVTVTCELDALRVWLRGEEQGSWHLCLELQVFDLLLLCNERRFATVYYYQIAAVFAGVVLLQLGHRHIALRIKNRRGDYDFRKEAEFFSGPAEVAYPYFMTWPRPALFQ